MEEFDAISIEIDRMEKLDMMQDPRYAEEAPELTIKGDGKNQPAGKRPTRIAENHDKSK